MMRLARLGLVFVTLFSVSVFSQRDDAHAAGAAWTANGATACATYLTPAVAGEILKAPGGQAQRIDANSCNDGPIYVSLKPGNVAVFRQELPMIAGAHPISGIGDAAYWNEAGALSAVKGDRGCDISVIIPGATKVSGAMLAQKLGAICNQLFALP